MTSSLQIEASWIWSGRMRRANTFRSDWPVRKSSRLASAVSGDADAFHVRKSQPLEVLNV